MNDSTRDDPTPREFGEHLALTFPLDRSANEVAYLIYEKAKGRGYDEQDATAAMRAAWSEHFTRQQQHAELKPAAPVIHYRGVCSGVIKDGTIPAGTNIADWIFSRFNSKWSSLTVTRDGHTIGGIGRTRGLRDWFVNTTAGAR